MKSVPHHLSSVSNIISLQVFFPVCPDKLQKSFYCLFFRNILFYTDLAFIKTDFASSCSYITVVSIRHLTGTIHDTAHDTDFQSCQV